MKKPQFGQLLEGDSYLPIETAKVDRRGPIRRYSLLALLLCVVGLFPSALPVQAESFVFFDRTYTHRGTNRLYSNWDFMTRMPHQTGAPKDWESPVNFRDGTFEFRVEVLEMEEIDENVQITFGWINASNDPQIKHTTGGAIPFAEPGIYEVEAGVQNLSIYRGDNDQLTREWDWSSAYASNTIYTIISPLGNPGAVGFPFRLHVTVKIFSKDRAKPDAPAELTAEVKSSSRIDLRWTDKSNNEEKFKINRFWQGSWKLIAEVGPDATTFSDTSMTPGRFYTYRIRAYHSQEGNSNYSNTASARTLKTPPALPDDPTAVRTNPKSTPPAFVLHDNYPNPFNAATTIRFTLPEAGTAALRIYDMAGHLVRQLLDHSLAAGQHEVEWDGRDDHGRELASGVYLYRLQVGTQVRTHKLLMLR